MSKFKNIQSRNLLLTVLVMDPNVRSCLRQFLRMGATNIRPDTMLIRKPESNNPDSYHVSQYNQVDDPGAWYGHINGKVSVMMLRSSDGSWFLNGY